MKIPQSFIKYYNSTQYKCEKRNKKSLLVVDMPKGSYKNPIQAKKRKINFEKYKCDAVKIESNNKNFKIIKEIVKSKIPVMGHIVTHLNLKIVLKLSAKLITKH